MVKEHAGMGTVYTGRVGTLKSRQRRWHGGVETTEGTFPFPSFPLLPTTLPGNSLFRREKECWRSPFFIFFHLFFWVVFSPFLASFPIFHREIGHFSLFFFFPISLFYCIFLFFLFLSLFPEGCSL